MITEIHDRIYNLYFPEDNAAIFSWENLYSSMIIILSKLKQRKYHGLWSICKVSACKYFDICMRCVIVNNFYWLGKRSRDARILSCRTIIRYFRSVLILLLWPVTALCMSTCPYHPRPAPLLQACSFCYCVTRPLILSSSALDLQQYMFGVTPASLDLTVT